MKRRSFLATITGIIAAPFVAKKAIAETPAAKPYTVAVDWARDSVPDRHSIHLIRVKSRRAGCSSMQTEMAGTWDSHRWELSKWQAWNEKMEEMTKTNLLSPPKP